MYFLGILINSRVDQPDQLAGSVSISSHIEIFSREQFLSLTLLHSERPKLYKILAFLSATGLREAASRDRNHLSGKQILLCSSCLP